MTRVAVRFHPEALQEYSDTADYYLAEAGAAIATRFVDEVETGIASIRETPALWSVVDEPDIRRYLTHHFPCAIYYRWQPQAAHADVYAVMHTSRRPGYWKFRHFQN